jgi:hypothetical protein
MKLDGKLTFLERHYLRSGFIGTFSDYRRYYQQIYAEVTK